jgi:predicted DsbA family dithiol-disulfide isomerase
MNAIAEREGVIGRADEKILEEVKGKEERVRDLGISGVPTFIFNRESGISGAYPPEQLAQAIREAAK